MATLPDQQQLIVDIVGPSFAGVFLYEVFFGVAVSMAWRYYDYSDDDPFLLKALVSWTLTFGIMQATCLFHYMWTVCISSWGDLDASLDMPVSGKLVNITTLLIVVPSQIFFARIAYRSLENTAIAGIAGKYIFLAFVVAGILIVTASGLATVINELALGLTYNSAPLFPNMYLWSIVAVEVMTSGVLVTRIKRLQVGVSEDSKNLLSRFIFLSLRTSSLTTSVALINRLLALGGKGLLGQVLGHFLSAVILLSLYHTLNSRKTLYLKPNSHNTSGGRELPTTTKGGGGQVKIETIVLRHVDRDQENGEWEGHEKDSGMSGSSRDPMSGKV